MHVRVSDIVADERSISVMGGFRKNIDKNWWLNIIGKGNKNRSITVCNDMLKEFKRYRKYLVLSQLKYTEKLVPLMCV
jgi:site-specific recombinase XerC